MTSLQDKIHSVGDQPKPKLLRHLAFAVMRWIVSALYLTSLAFSVAAGAGNPGVLPIPMAWLLLTATYAILMLLLWFYERFPPRTREANK